jgi:hypothetical protein
MPDPETQEMRIEQVRRARAERDQARAAGDPDERAQHERRAEKAAYLKRKLDQRARAEAEAEAVTRTKSEADEADEDR